MENLRAAWMSDSLNVKSYLEPKVARYRSHVEDYSSTLTVLVLDSVKIPISGFHWQHNFFFTRAALGGIKITTGTKATGKATTFSQWVSSFFPRPALVLPSSRQKIRKY
jgi:hypothetical protein